MDSDGSNPVNLTAGIEYLPWISSLAWSPDSQYLTFTQIMSDRSNIWKVSVVEQTVTNLTANTTTSANSGGVWSPSGELIAFVSDRAGNLDIWLFNSDGANLINLTEDNSLDDLAPSWSPDGRITFSSELHEDDWYLMVLSLIDGSSAILHDNAGSARWSPDGNYLAFEFSGDGGSNIKLIDFGSSKITDLIAHEDRIYPYDISWSSDNESIYFVSDQDGERDIWRINRDGLELANLTISHNGAVANFSMSADGAYIVFESNILGNRDIWLMKNDGSDLNNLTATNE